MPYAEGGNQILSTENRAENLTFSLPFVDRRGLIFQCPSAASPSQSRVQFGCSQRKEAGNSVVISRLNKICKGRRFLGPLTSKRIWREARISLIPSVRP